MTAKPSDKYIPLYFVAFFLVVFAVNAVFAYYAITTNPGVTTENAYEEGLKYNETINKAEAQEKLGVTADIKAENQKLTIELLKNGQPLKANVKAHIVRPNTDGHDYDTNLEAQEDGEYSIKENLPLKGLWEITILATWQENGSEIEYQKTKELLIK